MLSVKYALLHWIGITNWCPLSHRSSLYVSVATLIYHIRTKSPFNFGVFVLNQIKHHIGSKALKLPICYPWLICEILLSQKLDLLSPSKPTSLSPSLFNIHPCLLQRRHVFDINMSLAKPPSNGPSSELIASPFGSCVLQLLSNEAKDIEQLI